MAHNHVKNLTNQLFSFPQRYISFDANETMDDKDEGKKDTGKTSANNLKK